VREDDRRDRRKAGDRSAALAAELMKLPVAQLAKLEIEDALREAIDRARAVTTHIARRRAERTLAGDLRRFELTEIAAALDAVREERTADARQFHLAEQWRTRLIDGTATVADFPGGADDELPRLIDAARRERDTGRPPGAARALFRHIATRLKSA
jgi:ribosome-associated protein